MRKLIAAVVVAVAFAGSASAQSWQSEFGIQGGYSRLKPAGSGLNDHIDFFDVPGFGIAGVLPGNPALFAIIPWKNKIAIEVGAAAGQGNFFGGTDLSFLNLNLRADYALSPKFYGAAGGALHWVETGGIHETQLGVQAAVGYRFNFIAGLRARVEASALFLGRTQQVPPFNLYAVNFGVSKQLGGRTSAPARRGTATRAWEPMLGVGGGYQRVHIVGGAADFTSILLPATGGALSTLGVPAGGPPTLFAVLPIGEKMALEPGIDLHRFQTGGNTLFGGNLSARLNYAVSGGWYGAVGGNLQYFKVTGADAETVTGANVAWGYRFPIAGGLGGRVELNYTMMAKNDNIGLPPINTTGLMFGLTMPLR